VKTVAKYLVVRANGEARVVNRNARRLNLRLDEVAFPLTIRIGDAWGLIQAESITLDFPEAPAASVRKAGKPIVGEEES